LAVDTRAAVARKGCCTPLLYGTTSDSKHCHVRVDMLCLTHCS
jgi:hypothetical protein